MDIYHILQELCIELPTEKEDEFSAQCQMREKIYFMRFAQ